MQIDSTFKWSFVVRQKLKDNGLMASAKDKNDYQV